MSSAGKGFEHDMSSHASESVHDYKRKHSEHGSVRWLDSECWKNMYFDFVCPNSEFSKDIPFDFWLNMKSCCETDWACKLKHVKTEVDSLHMLGVKLRQLQHAILEAAWCKDRFLHVAGCPVLIWQAWMSSLQLMSSYSADTPIDLLTPIQMLAMFTGIQNKA